MMAKKEDGSIDHLFKQKWNLGKTTTIRIPMTLKNDLRDIARIADYLASIEIDIKTIVNDIKSRFRLRYGKINLQEIICFLRELADSLESIKDVKDSKNTIKYSTNKYNIAAECCREYLRLKGIDLDVAQTARKKTIKRELAEVVLWLENNGKKS